MKKQILSNLPSLPKSKRLFAWLLALALLSVPTLLAGCERNTPETETGTAEPAQTEEAGEAVQTTDGSSAAGAVTVSAGGSRVVVRGSTAERALTDAEKQKYPQETNLPALYITLAGGKSKSDIKHGSFSQATYTLVNNGTGIVEQPIEIGGRGNFSWSFDQKTYNLKLGTAEPLLGMTAGRKWVLITTWSDKTCLRNFITLNFASELLGMDYACETRFCDVYINGKYNGLYVLSEKIALSSSRVDADALFECEAQYRHGDCSNCIVCPSGCHIIFKEPLDDETLSKTDKEGLYKTYKQLMMKADVSLTKGIDVYSRYIDVDSFVDWYIVNELAKNYDSGFTTSCYCYAKDGKIYMGPCWDYDTCYGNQNVASCLWPEGYHVAGSPWYGILMEDEGFRDALHKRWTQLVDDGVIQKFLDVIDEMDEMTDASEQKDHKLFRSALTYTGLRGNLSTTNHEDEVAYLKAWVRMRIKWLNSEWYLNGTPKNLDLTIDYSSPYLKDIKRMWG